MFEVHGLTAGDRQGEHLTNTVDLIGMNRIEPHRRPGVGRHIRLPEQFHAATGVVHRVGDNVPVPQPVVGGNRVEAVALLAGANGLDQVLLLDRRGQRCGPLVVSFATVGGDDIDFAGVSCR